MSTPTEVLTHEKTRHSEMPDAPREVLTELTPHRYAFYLVEKVQHSGLSGTFIPNAVEEFEVHHLTIECTPTEARQHAVRMMARFPGKKVRVFREELLLEIPR